MISSRVILAIAVSFLITAPIWARIGSDLDHSFRANAQATYSVPGSSVPGAVTGTMASAPCGGIGVACAPPTTTGGGGGMLDIGQAFGPTIGPYVNSFISSLIFMGVTWLGMFLKNKFSINIDESQRSALTQWAQNQAASLIADGMVRMVGTKIHVDPTALEAAANSGSNVIPDALKHWDLDGPKGIEPLKAKIIDTIPQTKAGAAIVAQAHVNDGGGLVPATAG